MSSTPTADELRTWRERCRAWTWGDEPEPSRQCRTCGKQFSVVADSWVCSRCWARSSVVSLLDAYEAQAAEVERLRDSLRRNAGILRLVCGNQHPEANVVLAEAEKLLGLEPVPPCPTPADKPQPPDPAGGGARS